KGRALLLTTAEFELLGLLVRNRGRVLTRDRIMEAMRGIDAEAYDRSIDVLVSRVRQKLGDDAKRSMFIRTVRGIGYSFSGDDRGYPLSLGIRQARGGHGDDGREPLAPCRQLLLAHHQSRRQYIDRSRPRGVRAHDRGSVARFRDSPAPRRTP